MPDQYGNWLPQDLFAGAIPQLQPKWDSGQNMLTAPGLGVPVGLAGGVVGTAVGNPLVAGALDAAKLPGDVYQGKVDLNSPAGFGRAQNMAGMLMGGGMPMAEAGALGMAGGRLKSIGGHDLPLNPDGTVTLYHATNKNAANSILQSKTINSAGEPSVYFSTVPSGTGYGEHVLAVDVPSHLLKIDDEFPGGRVDYRVDKKSLEVGNVRKFP